MLNHKTLNNEPPFEIGRRRVQLWSKEISVITRTVVQHYPEAWFSLTTTEQLHINNINRHTNHHRCRGDVA